MKHCICYILLLFIFSPAVCMANGPGGESMIKSYLFDEVIIEGTSNVKSFQLSYREDQFTRLKTNANETDGLKISIPAKKIEAESKMMLADFLKLINAKEHPDIDIKIDPQATRSFLKEDRIDHGIQLTMNGITNNYRCLSEVEDCYQQEKCLSGTLKINLRDFNIEPPQKFFGIVKVEEEVFISFRILFSTQ